MVDILDETDFTNAELQEDINNNRRSWMSNDVLLGFRGEWMRCYPGSESDKRWTMDKDSIDADFFRDYQPYEASDYPSCEVVPNGLNMDLEKLLFEVNMYDVMMNWFNNLSQINACVENELNLGYLIRGGDMECNALQDVISTLL